MRTKSEIAKKFKKIVEENDLKVASLAKIIGVSRQQVYNYIEGKSIIPTEQLYRTGDVYGVSITYFLED